MVYVLMLVQRYLRHHDGFSTTHYSHWNQISNLTRRFWRVWDQNNTRWEYIFHLYCWYFFLVLRIWWSLWLRLIDNYIVYGGPLPVPPSLLILIGRDYGCCLHFFSMEHLQECSIETGWWWQRCREWEPEPEGGRGKENEVKKEWDLKHSGSWT